MRTFLFIGLVIAGLVAAAIVSVYWHLGAGGLKLLGLATGVAIAGEAVGVLLMSIGGKKSSGAGILPAEAGEVDEEEEAKQAGSPPHGEDSPPRGRARPQAVAVIGIAWNLPFVVWLCLGPRFWPHFDLVAAGACFAFALLSLVMSRSTFLQTWLYGPNPPPPAKSFYFLAALIAAFGMGGVLSAIFRG